ncbi:MAG: hypothetical protein ACXADU_02850 [Promethearchaeota archaeon]|jgi:hypothetical protein
MFNLFNIISFSTAQTDDDGLTVYSTFNFIEFGEQQGQILNTSTLEFTVPSDTWNLTNIELNFTDIRFKRNIYGIEDEIRGPTKPLDKQEKAYAVQINITEPTEIYAAHIHGLVAKTATTTDIYVQINGYDSVSDQPNNTIYGSTLINITSESKWHIQNFSSPISLQVGYYYLVINGSEMLPSDAAKYYWGYNDINPKNPNFWTWVHLGGVWINGITGEPFLYKLDQKILTEFYPDEINMTAQIGETNYPISNGIALGSGSLNANLTFPIQAENFTVAFHHNKSHSLIFNTSFNLKLRNSINTPASALINGSSDIEWSLEPPILRSFQHYSVEFTYPSSWENITVFRKTGLTWDNMNSEIILIELSNKIFLPNSTILEGATWRVTATSPNIDFSLDFPEREWNPGQTIQFTVFAPTVDGNLTFVVINTDGFEEHYEVKPVLLAETHFNYTIPTYPVEGEWTAKIYWNNSTAAGFQNKQFQVDVIVIPFTLPLWLIILIVVGVSAGLSVISVVSYRSYKKMSAKRIEKEQKTTSECIDALNLDYMMVTDKKSGLNVYTQNFSGREIDAELISGFLQAIHTFGIELMRVEDRSQTIRLEYRGSIILMSEFVNLRLMLLMKESPSRFFLYSIEELAYDIYKNYGDNIDEFNGDIAPFKGIEDLLKRHINPHFIYPLKLSEIDKFSKVRIGQNERELVNKAVHLMKTENKDYFYAHSLLPEEECSPKDVESFLNLIDKEIFKLAEDDREKREERRERRRREEEKREERKERERESKENRE